MRTSENGRPSKYQCPRSLMKTNPIYIFTMKSVASMFERPFCVTKSQKVVTVWVTMNPMKIWNTIMTANWLAGGIFFGIGKCLIQTFPIGVIGLYQSHPRTKNIAVPPARISRYANGVIMSVRKSAIEKKVRKIKDTRELSAICEKVQ